MVGLYDRGLRDPAQLDEKELVRFRLMLFIAVEGAQASFLVRANTQQARKHWNALESLCLQTMGTPGGRAWWALLGHSMHPEFASHVGAFISETSISRTLTKEQWITALNALALEKP